LHYFGPLRNTACAKWPLDNDILSKKANTVNCCISRVELVCCNLMDMVKST